MGSLRIAIDLGAGSGRLFYGNYREFKEIYRFPNTWNFGETLAFIRTGLAMLAGHRVDSISCSSWAQDFGLLDKNGELFYEPVSYLSGRADAIPDEIASLIPADELVQLAGVRRISEISTLAQWKYMANCEPGNLQKAGRLLPVGDLVNFKLSGNAVLNFSLASAAMLLEKGSCKCNRTLLKKLGLDPQLAGEFCNGPGVIGKTVVGDAVPPELAGIPVISGIGHDTAAAFYGCEVLPGEAALSLGSWAMLGTPENNFAEVAGTSVIGIIPDQYVRISYCHGMRLLQQCILQWKTQGVWRGFEEFDAAVKKSDFAGTFDVSATHCPPPGGDMLKEISDLCSETPESMADFGKAICRSIARGIAGQLAILEKAANCRFRCLKVAGGGTADPNLMEELQYLLPYPLIPVSREASVLGNLLIQERIAG